MGLRDNVTYFVLTKYCLKNTNIKYLVEIMIIFFDLLLFSSFRGLIPVTCN